MAISAGIPQGELVFEWNKVDISQWNGINPVFSTPAGAENSTLSVVASSERGNVLRMTADGVATPNMRAVWICNTPIPFPTTRRDFSIEVEFAAQDVTASRLAGVVFMADGSASNYFQHYWATTGEGTILRNNGVQEFVSFNANQFNDGGRSVYTMRGDKPAGGPPRSSVYTQNSDETNLNGHSYRTGSSSAIRGAVTDMGNNTTFNASWNAIECDRFGISILSANTGPLAIDILDYRVYLVGGGC